MLPDMNTQVDRLMPRLDLELHKARIEGRWRYLRDVAEAIGERSDFMTRVLKGYRPLTLDVLDRLFKAKFVPPGEVYDGQAASDNEKKFWKAWGVIDADS